MCDKIPYETYAEAQHVINVAHKIPHKIEMDTGRRINRRQKPRPKRVYKCEECGKYHLTSKLKR